MKFRALFRRKKLDAEMAEEMRQHLERRAQANLAAGLSPEEARYAAQRQFGGVDRLKETARDQRGFLWLEHFGRDLRFAARQLAKSPGFTAVALLTLALGIGVNAAVFSLVNAFVLRPPVSLRPEELVNLFTSRHAANRDFRPFSHAEYLALREARDPFVEVAATRITSAGVAGPEGVRRYRAFFSSENYFPMMGVRPALGRFYTVEECRPNANIPVIVASYDLWQRYGGQSDFVGSELNVNGRTCTVIGVTPKNFNGVVVLFAVDLWVPLGLAGNFSAASRTDFADPTNYSLFLTARLAPGISMDSLAARLPSLAGRLTALQPDGTGARDLHAEPPSRQNISSQPSGGDPALPIAIGLFCMSGGVLLIACLNLANMLLARASGREKEIALRLALGASRWRIVRQVFAEGLALAGTGGALGLLVAVWANDLLVGAFAEIARLNGESFGLNVHPDGRVLVGTFLLCVVATLFFSLGPAMRASRSDLVHALKRQGGDAEVTGRFNRFFSFRHCLVMGQMALSLVLLFSAALFFRGALNAANVAPGFDPAGALVADLDYALTDLPPEAAKRSLFAALDRIAVQPGITSRAAANFVPYSSRSEGQRVWRADEPVIPDADVRPGMRFATVTYAAITDGYFDAVGARLLRGRDFTAAETRDPSAAAIAIVDETLVAKLFPEGNALGQRIRIGAVEREIVGICTPHRHNARRPDFPPRVFIPYAAGHDGRVFLVARYATKDDAFAAAAMAPLRSALRLSDPDLPLLQMGPYSRLVAQDINVWLVRVGAIMFGLFGVIALLLAVVGVYGVKAYAVSRRTREFGIRMAIGAQARDVFGLLLKQGALQIFVALGAGLLLSLGAGRILAKMLYQVSPTDPFALIAAAMLLGCVALLACWVPARRATKIDPVIALRSE
ncbi:MAG: ABC transporter permease [Opitutaceae bacterium]